MTPASSLRQPRVTRPRGASAQTAGRLTTQPAGTEQDFMQITNNYLLLPLRKKLISRQNPPAPPPLLRCGCRRGWVLSSLLRPAPASCGPLPGLWTLWTPDNDTLQSTSHITCNRSHMEHNTRLGTGGHYRLLTSPCSCTAPIRRSPSSLNTLITQSTALLHRRNTVTTDH